MGNEGPSQSLECHVDEFDHPTHQKITMDICLGHATSNTSL